MPCWRAGQAFCPRSKQRIRFAAHQLSVNLPTRLTCHDLYSGILSGAWTAIAEQRWLIEWLRRLTPAVAGAWRVRRARAMVFRGYLVGRESYLNGRQESPKRKTR